LEIRFFRGIPVKGRLLEHDGKPVRRQLIYHLLVDNPSIEGFADALSFGRTYKRLRPQYPACFDGPPAVEHGWEFTDENGPFLVRGRIPRLAFRLVARTPDCQRTAGNN